MIWVILQMVHPMSYTELSIIITSGWLAFWEFLFSWWRQTNRNIFRVTGHLNSPHKGQWRGALMFSLIWARINGWVNNGEAGDLRRHRAHYDVTVMITQRLLKCNIPDCLYSCDRSQSVFSNFVGLDIFSSSIKLDKEWLLWEYPFIRCLWKIIWF